MTDNRFSIFGIHEQALYARTQRTQVLANNIANADTPGYQARDIDFKAVMSQAIQQQNPQNLNQNHQQHLSALGVSSDQPELLYRNPLQPSIDGNTVDVHAERAAFAQNTLEFQASFQFANARVRGIISALRGD